MSNWGTCYSGSNNLHFDSPPLMSDQRAFTSYDPNNELNEVIIKEHQIKSNYDYRQFLIANGEKIIKNNQLSTCNMCGFCQYGPAFQSRNKEGKYLYKGSSDTYTPYGYEMSDLKAEYLERQSLQSRLDTPVLSQQELLHITRSN